MMALAAGITMALLAGLLWREGSTPLAVLILGGALGMLVQAGWSALGLVGGSLFEATGLATSQSSSQSLEAGRHVQSGMIAESRPPADEALSRVSMRLCSSVTLPRHDVHVDRPPWLQGQPEALR